MARLRRTQGTEEWLLPGRSVLGRSRACTIRLADPEVSGEQAALGWKNGVWEVQDLHSRNGTFVERRRLAPGERVGLTAGATLGFGRVDGYVLVDADAPEPFAEPIGGGPPIAAAGEILALPDADAPEVTIYRGQRSGWAIEQGGEIRELVDGAIVHTPAGAWRVWLPESLASTADADASEPSIATIGLRFAVSRDEEYVELLAVHPGGAIDLKARAHHHPLLLLARARLRDAALPEDQQGWIRQDDLLRMLRVDAGRLHIDIYRIRRQLADANVRDAARIVERRPGTRQLRLGVRDLEIRTLDAASPEEPGAPPVRRDR